MNIYLFVIALIIITLIIISILYKEKFVQYNLQELNFHRPLIDCDTKCMHTYTDCSNICTNHTCINYCGLIQSNCIERCKDVKM